VPPGLWLVNILFQRVCRINAAIPWMVHFTSHVSGRVEIGRHVWISFAVSGGCYIQGINGIRIGDETIFAPGVKIISANHDARCLERRVEAPGISIGSRCWLGANAVVLPGVTLGDDVIVAAGAVVTKSFPAGVTVSSVPARAISAGTPADVV